MMVTPDNPLGPFVPILVALSFRALLAYPVACHARKRGYSFRLFLVCGMISFVVTLIFAWLLPARDAGELSKETVSNASGDR